MDRRHFIKNSSTGLAGMALGSSAAVSPAWASQEQAMHFPGYPPYSSAEATNRAFGEYVAPSMVKLMRALGTEIHYGQREGARVQDAFTGKWYWDCHRNGTVYNLGHRNPDVIAAVREALQHLEVGNLFLASGYKAKAAEKLVESTGGELTGVTYTSSGSEATEVAIRAVRGFTRRRKLVSLEGSYHGSTCFAMAAGDNAEFRERYLLDFDDFVRVPFNDLDAMAATVDAETAGVLLEGTPAQLGFPVPDPGYYRGLEKICRKHGTRIIVDEVQTGLGATGTFWFWQQQGIVPDIITTAKGLGGGIVPNAAILMAPELKAWFLDTAFPHASTFAGNELGCVATHRVCELTMAPGFLERVRSLSQQFSEGFRSAPFKVNRNGLCMALVADGMDHLDMTRRLFAQGILVIPAEYHPHAVEFRPVLLLSENEAEQIIGLVRKGLSHAA